MRSFCIVPAAGASLRMGTPKLLLPWQGTTIIEHVLAAWREANVDRLLIVARAGDTDLIERSRRAGAEVIQADPPPADMKASVGLGLAHVARHLAPRSEDVWLTAPADLPFLSPDVIRALIAAHNPAAPRVLIACHQGRRGHPVLFPWSHAAKVGELAADEGLDRLVARSKPALIECGERAVCDDLDTPADYERLTG
ncbi:MAG TPA: nucleotidyltransferase family protein [Pirellulales bacterium]|nr:nucleotidyltransferase family protein [Pirellulales bacterium]